MMVNTLLYIRSSAGMKAVTGDKHGLINSYWRINDPTSSIACRVKTSCREPKIQVEKKMIPPSANPRSKCGIHRSSATFHHPQGPPPGQTDDFPLRFHRVAEGSKKSKVPEVMGAPHSDRNHRHHEAFAIRNHGV